MKFTRILLWFIAGTAFASSASGSPILYGITGSGNTASSLYTVDPLTGSTTLIGPTGLSHLTSLDFDPTSGVLYAVQSDLYGSGDTNLVTLNTSTGAATIVGPTGAQIPDITIGSDGILRGWSECSPDPTCPYYDDPIVIDKTNGAVTITLSDLGTEYTGVASESATSIFVKVIGDLYSVDVGTGNYTLLSNLGLSLNNILENMPTGDLISGYRTGGGTQLYSIDATTYDVTSLAYAPNVQFSALAYSVSVPEPATLALMGLGLAGIGAMRKRKVT